MVVYTHTHTHTHTHTRIHVYIVCTVYLFVSIHMSPFATLQAFHISYFYAERFVMYHFIAPGITDERYQLISCEFAVTYNSLGGALSSFCQSNLSLVSSS